MNTLVLAYVLDLIVLLLFGLSLGETGWIVRIYFKIAASTRALLPSHVFLVGLATLLLEVEAVWQIAIRFGDPFTWHTPFNLVAFSLLWVSLVTIRRHVTLRHHLQVANLGPKLKSKHEGETHA
jgi:hypothetical protein